MGGGWGGVGWVNGCLGGDVMCGWKIDQQVMVVL